MHVSIIATSCRRRERIGIGAHQPGGTSSQGLLIIRTLRLLSRRSPSDLPRLSRAVQRTGLHLTKLADLAGIASVHDPSTILPDGYRFPRFMLLAFVKL